MLDTHILLWALKDDARLSRRTRTLLRGETHTLLWSAASTWELAIKASLRRIQFVAPLSTYLPDKLASEGVETLPVTSQHAAATESLPLHHRDPFDRLLIAQAQIEDVPIVTADKAFRRYDVEIVF
ncbi:MAG: type II toxin-antitoxin system VapC family toxin [Pseudomonadota bacterium]